MERVTWWGQKAPTNSVNSHTSHSSWPKLGAAYSATRVNTTVEPTCLIPFTVEGHQTSGGSVEEGGGGGGGDEAVEVGGLA